MADPLDELATLIAEKALALLRQERSPAATPAAEERASPATGGARTRGALEVGARGDVVLWSGDPLETSSRAVAMWISGKQVPLTNRQTALFQKYRTVP